MEPKSLFFFFFLAVLFNLVIPISASNLQTYIVQLHPHGKTKTMFTERLDWHLSYLEQTVMSEEDPVSRFLYSYGNSMEGFAARLSEDELAVLQNMPDVIAIRLDQRLHLQTTYSYKFLGLSPAKGGAWSQSGYGQGSIVGVLDTGVWPESPSFDDRHMPPLPKRWKGVCENGDGFSSSLCNRKLIGARFYTKGHRASSTAATSTSPAEYASPRDSHGHGTHTSSTAAGASVPMASVLGNGLGLARGVAPGAHVAMYKVCWFSGCYSSDILAGIDDAIQDGVDVLSMSLGGFPIPLYDDNIAIGSFRAMEHGVLVICAAGNNGPIPSSVANGAPWITTVGASTLNRKFPASVHLGNGQTLWGESMYPGNRLSKPGKDLELVYLTGGKRGSELCFKGSLPRAKVRGKMVVCDRGVNGRAEKGQIVKEAGGAAMILANTEINLEEDSVDVHVLPATAIGYSEALYLKNYIKSTKRPTAQIEFAGTIIGQSRAPEIALFSSRGPSLTNPSILKPDLVAPGVNIIAAWPQNLGPSGLPEDTRRVNFTVLSGTSMACPHVSGIAALVRSAHPTWSPAAIRSAMMTTADAKDHLGSPILDGSKPAEIFAIGAGHVNPGKAIDPGLVYNIMPNDYVTHLCTLGYTKSEVFAITHRSVSCKEIIRRNRGFSLNYPSMTVIFKNGRMTKMVWRKLTNVGLPNSTYSVEVSAPEGVDIKVKPRSLTFHRLYQSMSYRVWLTSTRKNSTQEDTYAQGHLTWVHTSHSQYRIRSPISAIWAGKVAKH